MATRLGSSVVLAVGLSLAASAAPARAQGVAGDFDEVKNQLGLARLRLRNLAASVRARLDEADAAEARTDELRRRQGDQKIAVARVEAAFQQARHNADVAKSAISIYEETTSKQELGTSEYEITLAKAELKNAEDRLEKDQARVEEAKALVAKVKDLPKTTISDAMNEYYAGEALRSAQNQAVAAKFGVDKARFAVMQADTKKEVLTKYTKVKRERELQMEAEKAVAALLARNADFGLEKDKRAAIERHQSSDRMNGSLAITPAERSALAKFGALEPAWKGIIARRDDIEAADPAKRAEMKRLVDDFARALEAADRAWSSAREAQRDDHDVATMRLFRPAG